MTFVGIWDTGATNTVITQNVVDRCGLVQTGVAKVYHPQGETADVETYLVNVGLPGNFGVPGVRVTKGTLKDADLLIGMDIISLGDFAVTNAGGLTKFSFRVPSLEYIDFFQEAQAAFPPVRRAAQPRPAPKPSPRGQKDKRSRAARKRSAGKRKKL